MNTLPSHILLLGTPRITLNQQRVHIERRKALALLAYLVATRQMYPRETLAALFFPDADRSHAAAYLRNALWTIGKALGEDWAQMEEETIRSNPDLITDDLFQFTQLAQREAATDWADAAALYRGEFLAGLTLDDCTEFEEWRFLQAQHLARQYAQLSARLTTHYANVRDYATAITYARRWLAVDTLDEAAHRDLIRLYALSGQQAAALRQYQELAHRLEAELGTLPDAESQQVYEAVRARRLIAFESEPVAMPVPVPVAVLPVEVTEIDGIACNTPHIYLPVPSTPLIGRTREVTEIVKRLTHEDCRLLTLVGAGGIGKTRLALCAARELVSEFPDGVYFVSLAEVSYCEFVVAAVASALNFCPATEDLHQHLLDYLRDQRLLLVLDNFEHILSEAELVSHILANAPQVKVLATSRERLNLHEEWLYETDGLSYPPENSTEEAERFEAVRLFIQSARRVRSDFVVTDAAAIAEICRLVEGMPLGIELAATWVRMLDCAEIAAEIRTGLDFLATTTRNLPERHRSLRAVFEYSWQQLPPAEQAALSRLTLLHGGFQQAAAQSIAGASLHSLLALIEKSLLRRTATGRYVMHELLRQYAEQKLTSADRAEAQRRFYRYFADVLFELGEQLKTGQQVHALDEIEREIANIRVAWRLMIDARDVEALARAWFALLVLWQVRGYIDESVEMTRYALDALNASSPDPAERRVVGLLMAGHMLKLASLGRRDQINRLYSECRTLLKPFEHNPQVLAALATAALAQDVTNSTDLEVLAFARDLYITSQQHVLPTWERAWILYILSSIEHRHIYYKEARQHIDESLTLFRATGQPSGIAMALGMVAESAFTLGDYPLAMRSLEEALPLLEAVDDRAQAADMRTQLIACATHHDEDEKLAMLQRSLLVYQEMNDKRRITWTTHNIGWIHYLRGEYAEAMPFVERSYPGFQAMADLEGEAWSLILRASLELELGNYEQATQFAEACLRRIDDDLAFPWGRAGALYVLGDVALRTGNLEAAQQHYTRAVQIVHSVQALLQTLRHLNGIADVLRIQGNWQQAAALNAFIRAHPTAWDDVKCRADATHKLLTHLTPADFDAAQSQAAQWTLADVVATYAPQGNVAD